jgi:hypothetical protein
MGKGIRKGIALVAAIAMVLYAPNAGAQRASPEPVAPAPTHTRTPTTEDRTSTITDKAIAPN